MEKIAGLKEFRVLDLSRTGISARGLARLTALPKLERLSLADARKIDDAAAVQLTAMRSLRWLDLAGTAVTEKTSAPLKNLAR
jgi:hypothetical protein